MTASAWLAAIRPSRTAMEATRWLATRGQSQTVPASPQTAAAIVSSTKDLLVSPMS